MLALTINLIVGLPLSPEKHLQLLQFYGKIRPDLDLSEAVEDDTFQELLYSPCHLTAPFSVYTINIGLENEQSYLVVDSLSRQLFDSNEGIEMLANVSLPMIGWSLHRSFSRFARKHSIPGRLDCLIVYDRYSPESDSSSDDNTDIISQN